MSRCSAVLMCPLKGRTNYRRTAQDTTGQPQDSTGWIDGDPSLGGIRPPEGGGLAYPCRVPIYMWLYMMVWLCRHHDPCSVAVPPTLHVIFILTATPLFLLVAVAIGLEYNAAHSSVAQLLSGLSSVVDSLR